MVHNNNNDLGFDDAVRAHSLLIDHNDSVTPKNKYVLKTLHLGEMLPSLYDNHTATHASSFETTH